MRTGRRAVDDGPQAFGEIETPTDQRLGGHIFPFSIGSIEKCAGHFQRHTTQVQDAKEINAPARFLPAYRKRQGLLFSKATGEKTVLATEHEEFFIFETHTPFHVHGVRCDDTIFHMLEQQPAALLGYG